MTSKPMNILIIVDGGNLNGVYRDDGDPEGATFTLFDCDNEREAHGYSESEIDAQVRQAIKAHPIELKDGQPVLPPLPVDIYLLRSFWRPGDYRALRIQTTFVRHDQTGGQEIVVYNGTNWDDDGGVNRLMFSVYGVDDGGLSRHIADRSTLADAVDLARKLGYNKRKD